MTGNKEATKGKTLMFFFWLQKEIPVYENSREYVIDCLLEISEDDW